MLYDSLIRAGCKLTSFLMKPIVVMPVSEEEMEKERVPLVFRDYCAHLLIPLNRCRLETYYLPWKCGAERHEYERCQYVEYVQTESQ